MAHVAVGGPAAASVRAVGAIMGLVAVSHLGNVRLVTNPAPPTTATAHARNVALARAALLVEAACRVMKANTQMCDLGKYSAQPGASVCSHCNPDHITVNAGSSVCTACEPGRFQDSVSTCSTDEKSVSFATTLNLPFAQWESKKLVVEAGLATRMGVAQAKVKILSVREGSTIVDFKVTVTNITYAYQTVATIQQQASSGTLSLGGVNATSISPPVSLISTGPSILAINPNIGPRNGGTVVTISGSFATLPSPVCLVDGQAAATQLSGANLLCTMPPSMGRSHMISLQGGAPAER